MQKEKIEAQAQRPNLLSQGGFRRSFKHQFMKGVILSNKSTAREESRKTAPHTHTLKHSLTSLKKFHPGEYTCNAPFFLSVFISWFYLSCKLHNPVHDCYVSLPLLSARQTFLDGHCSALEVIHKFYIIRSHHLSFFKKSPMVCLRGQLETPRSHVMELWCGYPCFPELC